MTDSFSSLFENKLISMWGHDAFALEREPTVQHHVLCVRLFIRVKWQKENVVSRHFTILDNFFASFSDLWKLLLSEHGSLSCGPAVLPAQRWDPCSSGDSILFGHSNGRWSTHVFVLAKKLNWLKHFYASPSCEGVFVPAPVLSFWRHIQQEHSSTSSWHLGSYYLKFWVAKTQLWWTCMKRTTLDIFRANKDSIIKDSCLSYCVE